jgi:hypothetical protein
MAEEVADSVDIEDSLLSGDISWDTSPQRQQREHQINRKHLLLLTNGKHSILRSEWDDVGKEHPY